MQDHSKAVAPHQVQPKVQLTMKPSNVDQSSQHHSTANDDGTFQPSPLATTQVQQALQHLRPSLAKQPSLIRSARMPSNVHKPSSLNEPTRAYEQKRARATRARSYQES